VASLIKYVVDRWRKFEGQIVHPGNSAYDDNAPTFTDDAYFALQLGRSKFLLANNREFEGNFTATLSYISEIKRLCDSHNIALTIVLIPA
jgi:hypothetical protein